MEWGSAERASLRMGEEEDDDQGVPTRAGLCTAPAMLGDRSRGRSTRAQMGLKILDRRERRRENRSISLPSLARPTDRATARLHLSSLDGCINIPCVFAPVREREGSRAAVRAQSTMKGRSRSVCRWAEFWQIFTSGSFQPRRESSLLRCAAK